MLTIRNIFDVMSMFREVIPVERPVVVTVATDSKSESKKFFWSKSA